MAKRPIQLSLFDLAETPTIPPPPSTSDLLPKPQLERGDALSDISELPQTKPVLETFLPKLSKKELKQQKLLEDANFQALVQWLKSQLQPHFTLPIEIRNIHGRTKYVSFKKEGNVMMLRIHKRFAQAPEFILHALVNWLKGPRKKPPKIVEQYIAELSTITARIQRNIQPKSDLPTKGKFYDLKKLYEEVNQEWFNGQCNVAIGWGRMGPKNARTRHLGSYSAPYHRVSIHPLLDSQDIPEYVVKFVIFHELLHSRQPPSKRNPHDTAFRVAERTHPDYERVKQWEKEFFGKAIL